jgi:CRISPR-associated protein (TIGR02710 family)
MIVSVGGTPDPLVKAILTHKPQFVCFFASQESLDLIGEIKRTVKCGGHTPLQDYKVVCEDVGDIIHCYGKALECAEKLSQVCRNPEDVFVDYTGGTKTMTAALTLATVNSGFRFSYVGGTQRTKNGLGVVVSGTEVIQTGISPWKFFAVEEKKRVSLFVSSFQYQAAIATMEETIDRLEPGEQEVWTAIVETLRGFYAWDTFNHKRALTTLSTSLKKLQLCGKFCHQEWFSRYIDQVGESFGVLEEIKNCTRFFKMPHLILVRDLVSNACRRSVENKYDDAVARLYRALEMAGQIAFQQATGCSTSDVDPEKLPAALKEDYVKRYSATGKVQVGLTPTFNVLKELSHPAGLKFAENEEALRKMLSARNESILAHGSQPIKKETYEKLTAVIEQLFVEGPLIEFPALQW